MYASFKKLILDHQNHEFMQYMTREFLHFVESNSITLKILETLVNEGDRYTHKKLNQTISGIKFDNPLLVAAGWDKAGRSVKALQTIGFAGVEVGTVTAYPQNGNLKPRLHLLSEDVVLNSMGFPSPGMETVSKNLNRYKDSKFPIGINIGKNKYIPFESAPFMHSIVVRRLYEYASYFTLGISSPNTPNLKTLQKKEFLLPNVRAINEMMISLGKKKPLFIKVAPEIDESTLDSILEIITNEELAGIIAANTYSDSNIFAKYGEQWEEAKGGLSGNDEYYQNLTTGLINKIFNKTKGNTTIIGVGGINSTENAIEKIQAGASLLQIYSGIYSVGPRVANKINKGIVEFLEKENISNISELVGTKQSKKVYVRLKTLNKLEKLKEEYLELSFQNKKDDILLINNKPFELKNGEFGRKFSHIFLNNKSKLFNDSYFQELVSQIFKIYILQNLKIDIFNVFSIPTSASFEISSLLQRESKENVKKFVLLPESIKNEEKGLGKDLYSEVNEENIFMIDDVFTSGNTMLDAYTKINITNLKIGGIVLNTRNIEVLNKFNKENQFKVEGIFSLDEIIEYNWSKLNDEQKEFVKSERSRFQ